MKLISNNISPLPFYDDLEKQNHRKDYAFGQIYPLVTYRNMLLPFQVILAGGSEIVNVSLYCLDRRTATEITGQMIENGLTLSVKSGYIVLKYPATLPITDIVHEGYYYLSVNIKDLGTIYSDIFCVRNNVDDFLEIKYRNHYDFELLNGIIDFSSNFTFRCYLPTQVGKPDYEFEEEATERMGYTFIESQVSKKIYKFTFTAPEYLCDALRIVRLCDSKEIYSKGRYYEITNFNIDVDWQEQGDLAAVECEFETDNVIANLGGYKPELSGGDFNKDFNNDYKIE